jgi:Chaperone of endosialidase
MNKKMKPTKTTTPLIRNSVNRSRLRRGFLLTPFVFALAWLALSPLARAQCRDGCDSNHGSTFQGVFALGANTTGAENTAFGDAALNLNTTGSANTAVGFDALLTNKTGSANTATGFGALFKNTATNNTATGSVALEFNTTGTANTANGAGALRANTTGSNNTAVGEAALLSNTTASDNTANGLSALKANTTGGGNVALGYQAGLNLTTGSNNIDIGAGVLGVAAEANTIRIGTTQIKTFIAGIHGATASGGAAVFINASGELGTLTSSARFKEAIKPMDEASEAILALKPVTFRYKKEIDPDRIRQFGLVAEQVEKVNPDLVARDEKGQAYTVRYEAVNAMLLNEFLKEHKKVEELKATVAQQQKGMEVLAASLKEQASQIQKVSAQVELNKPAAQMAVNNQ